jgi:DNA-binding NtrC family response regulator
VDYCLPDGNALRLIPKLKSIDPSIPVIVLTGYGSIDLAVKAVRLGADHFLTKPTELETLSLVIQRSLENQRNRQKQLAENSRMRRDAMDPFLGKSTAIRKLSEWTKKVAFTDSPVLIQGETGTGKGVLARWLHYHGPRAPEPFVDLNCSSFSRDLVESELFGYQCGAFTGAVHSKSGLLEIAHKGTVFLDEIGDLDLQIQPKLLKVLEDKQFRRLGDVCERRVDIHLLAATHQSVVQLVQEKRFRDDLYFRISAIPLTVPPLRERVEDIPTIAECLLDRLAVDLGGDAIQLTPGAMRAFLSYSWPGNIRELRNILERALLLSGSRVLGENDLHFDPHVDLAVRGNGIKTLEEMKRQHIEEVLSLQGWHITTAAQKLGIPRSSLYQQIKHYGIHRAGRLP